MRITDMNWMQVEAYLRTDDRCVLPLGSTEQHAYLSLSVDSLLSEKLAIDVAEPLGIPVFPVQPYGITPYFLAYPGSVSLRTSTYLALIGDVLDSLAGHGFKRILIVNGHGGNLPAATLCEEWMNAHQPVKIKFHNWWNAPATWARVQSIDAGASHASWMENFPWTRLPGVALPEARKAAVPNTRRMSAQDMRTILGDGNFAGFYQRPDDEMHEIWRIATDETRALLTSDWA